jgi:hypothetical protein
MLLISLGAVLCIGLVVGIVLVAANRRDDERDPYVVSARYGEADLGGE